MDPYHALRSHPHLQQQIRQQIQPTYRPNLRPNMQSNVQPNMQSNLYPTMQQSLQQSMQLNMQPDMQNMQPNIHPQWHHHHHHQPTPEPIPSPSLVCVGGMLRVAPTPAPRHAIHTPALSPTPVPSPSPAPTPTSSIRFTQPLTQPNVTPFKQLASPFTASAPFTAPTTPYSIISTSSTIPTTPHSTSTSTTLPITPYSTTSTYSTPANPLYSLLTPAQTPSTNYDLQPQPQTQVLTQKQVRELRRLCRKTANRAEFEHRLIQIRQVASIAAMANTTIPLFDPTNTASGYALRAWVEKHRAEGADWRDERPLSCDAIIELRRWDRLLKAWARVRFENQAALDSRYMPTRNTRPDLCESALKPVRLEFEQMSLAQASSPATPATAQKSRNVYSTDFLRLGSPCTPAESTLHHHLANSPTAPLFSQQPKMQEAGIATPDDAQVRSAWSRPPLTGINRWGGSRKPLSELSINRVGDTINISVPRANANGAFKTPLDVNSGKFVAAHDEENVIPAEIRRAAGPLHAATHASTTAKSWRNALMQTPERKAQEERVQVVRTAGAQTLLTGREDVDVNAADGGLLAPRSPMDWGKFRRGEASQSGTTGNVWQTRADNA